MARTLDHEKPDADQISLFHGGATSPAVNRRNVKRPHETGRQLILPTMLPKRNVTTKSKNVPSVVQYTFGVVVIDEKDRQRWKRETQRRRKSRVIEISAIQNEGEAFYAALLVGSLSQFDDVKDGVTEKAVLLRNEILAWILAPQSKKSEDAAPRSFQKCCYAVGWDPEEIAERFRRAYLKKESTDVNNEVI